MSLAARIGGGDGSNKGQAGGSGRSTPTGRAPSRSKQQQRPAPYVKSPPQAAAPSLTNAGARQQQGSGVDGDKWDHDLFNPLSDLYNPSVNVNNPALAKKSGPGHLFGKAMGGLAQPSSSLRPFGASTPPARVVSPMAADASSSQYAPDDLFGRFGVQGINSSNSSKQPQAQSRPTPTHTDSDDRRARIRQMAEAEEAARLKLAERKAQKQAEASQKAEREAAEARQRQLQIEQQALDMEMSRQQEEELELQRQRREANSVNVIVKNLVDGTTPEDVKAAFADFGEIGECRVLESNGETLTMLVEFSDRKDATSAVQKLDGALADGLTLRLSIQEKPKPAPQGMALKGSQTRKANIRNAAAAKKANGIPTGPRAQQGQAQSQSQARQPAAQQAPQQAMQVEVPQAPVVQSRMRSEQLIGLDPRASIQTAPMQQQVGSRSRAQPHGQQQQRQAGQPNLAARFGVSSGVQQQQGGFAQQGRGQQSGSGLLARLGQGQGNSNNARRDDAMDLS